MQSVGSVVFNIFNSDPDRANSHSRCVQLQGHDQSNRRVHGNKDVMPSTHRDAPSTSFHKTGGRISSLNLGSVKPVLLLSTLANQFSPLFGRAHSAAETDALLSPPGALPSAVDNCSPDMIKEMARTAVEKIMAISSCSAEAASHILNSMVELAEGCDDYTLLQMLGVGVGGGIDWRRICIRRNSCNKGTIMLW